MIADISDKEISGLYKTGIIQQTAYWSAVKKCRGYNPRHLILNPNNLTSM